MDKKKFFASVCVIGLIMLGMFLSKMGKTSAVVTTALVFSGFVAALFGAAASFVLVRLIDEVNPLWRTAYSIATALLLVLAFMVGYQLHALSYAALWVPLSASVGILLGMERGFHRRNRTRVIPTW